MCVGTHLFSERNIYSPEEKKINDKCHDVNKLVCTQLPHFYRFAHADRQQQERQQLEIICRLN